MAREQHAVHLMAVIDRPLLHRYIAVRTERGPVRSAGHLRHGATRAVVRDPCQPFADHLTTITLPSAIATDPPDSASGPELDELDVAYDNLGLLIIGRPPP
jgi:hypothetical protein